MKRSQINQAIEKALTLLNEYPFHLPAFGYWTKQDWAAHKAGAETILKLKLGWDVTDFGRGNFEEIGAVLFTLRNGLPDASLGTPYAEKIIVLFDEKEQQIPMHCHISKTEDIINRGHGVMCIKLFSSNEQFEVDTQDEVSVWLDGVKKTVPAGSEITLLPGESITLTPGVYHSFAAKKGHGNLIIGEVSTVNDDSKDNVFLETGQYYNQIEEDADILYPIASDFERFFEQGEQR